MNHIRPFQRRNSLTLHHNYPFMIRNMAKFIYHLIGWKLEGRYPSELKKMILIVAPHTSSMDFPIGILVKFWLDIKASFYAKEELFKGVVGWILSSLGGLPVNRSINQNLVGQAIADFKSSKDMILLITPEGTRKKVNKFKSGFYHIALNANVPVIPIAFDYANKVIRIMPTYIVKGDGEQEIEEIRQMFVGIIGKVQKYSIT